MPQLRFVAYDRSALNGSPLGEITEAAAKHVAREFNDYGDGQFQISRHGDADQLVWTRLGRYIRAWRDTITGDPIASFFIEDSGDTVLAEEEDGVEDYVRQGRGPMRYLKEAIIWYESVTGNDAAAPDPDGIWLWPEVHPAGIMVRQLEEAQERGALPDLTYDFTRTHDSDGNPWTLTCDDFQLQTGDVDLDDLRGRLTELGLVFEMKHDFLFRAWEAGNVGTDLSASITLAKGTDIATSAEREQHWGDLKSTILVKGKRGDTGAPVFVPVDSAAALTETTRRIEGFVDASETSGYDALQQIGQSAIYRQLRRHAGPTKLGVLDKTGQIALVDYVPGDTVTVDVPGIWNEEAKQVTSISLDETDNGEYDVTVGFDEEPTNDSSGSIAIKPLVPQATPECCPVPGPFVPVVVTDDTCPSPTASGSYGPNLSATSVSPGNVFYIKPGFIDPGLVPNPGYVGGWSFAIFNSGGVDYAGDCTGSTARCLVIGDGIMVIHTATYSGSPRALTATLYHVVAGIPIADATVHGTTGDDLVIPVSSEDGLYCTHYVDVVDDGGTCGGKWGFAGFDWTRLATDTVTNRPSAGQSVIEGWVGDGSTTTGATNYPYLPGSLEVHVDGLLVGVTETDPTTGEFEYDSAPGLGAPVVIRYQAASGTATGAGNDPTPDPYTPAGSASLALDDLTDVNAPSPSDGDLLAWDNGSGKWVPVTPSSGITTPVDHGNLGSTETIDASAGAWHRGVLNANAAITVSGFTIDEALVVIVGLTQDGTGGWDITWDSDVVFSGDDQPGQTAGDVTWYALWSDEGDATIYGAIIGGGATIAALDDIPDVNAPSPSDGDVLTWDSTPGEWVARTPTVVADLDDLTDVVLTAPAVADRLRYDGSSWVNSPLIWRPVTTYDGTNWLPVVDGDGNAVMTEA